VNPSAYGRGLSLAIPVLVAALAGCGAAPHTRGAGAIAPLAVRAVEWNPTQASVGRVHAVAEAGNVVVVFGDSGVRVLSSGALVASDGAVTDWVDAAAIRGADGAERWIVGVDGRGQLHYVRGLGSLDDVSGRYGLQDRRIRSATALDGERSAFLLDDAVAVAGGGRVTRYAATAWSSLAGGAGFGAAVTRNGVVLFDASTLQSRTYALAGATRAVVGPDGRLFVSTPRSIYASTPGGDLGLLFDAEHDTLHGLVASGSNVWFADGAELGVVAGAVVAETSAARLPSDSDLAPSSSGDVWVLAAGTLQRFARVAPDASLWASRLSPVFARACSSCHEPKGVAGVDLSTLAAWQAEQGAIRERVVVGRTMPPEGHALSEEDREAIRAWATPQK